MEEKKYSIYYGDEPEATLAQHMSLETALLMIQAYAEKYWGEHLYLTIKEEVEEE